MNFQIFDLGGRVLPFDESNIKGYHYGFSIDVSTLPNGMYFAKIQANELEVIEKFIIKK